jgi:hypothetical protein
MRTRLAVVVLFLLLASAVPAGALGAVWADARLDAVSSEVAGRPVRVQCDTDEAAWQAVLAQWRLPGRIAGFADIPNSIDYLSADVCIYLQDALESGPGSLGRSHGWALLVLVHEAVHQRGGAFNCSRSPDPLCEGYTDCAALALVPKYVGSFFGVRKTVTETWTEYRYKRVKIKVRGKVKWVRRRVAIRRSEEVENAVYEGVMDGAQRAHDTAPPPYNMTCTT